MKSAPSIAFDYRPSSAVASLACAIAAAAAAAPWFSALPVYAKALLSLAAIAYGVVALRRFLHADFRRVAYRASGWTLVDVSDVERIAELASHARYAGWI